MYYPVTRLGMWICVRFIGQIMHDPSCLLLYLSLTFRQTNCRCPKSSLHTRRHTHFTRTHSHTTDNKSHTFTKLTPANIDPARMYALTHARTHENSGSKCRWQYTAHASDYIVLCFYGKPIFFCQRHTGKSSGNRRKLECVCLHSLRTVIRM